MALVDEVKAPKLQVISRDDPIPCNCPKKEKTRQGALTFQMLLLLLVF